MEPSEWINFIRQVGFPIAVTFYVLLRLEKSFQQLSENVQDMIDEMRKR
ncbi:MULTISPECIES: YvrJ family protein [Aneurinibacillus]|uniref:YvrJ family protein n=1 Tax=Aneurinibacillus thermoaerophilus TaxID=143495 RepID=A0ABX8YGM0_ANETH|nr:MULTISPECIES: YvrJ family protein [Aneurinibacillus]MED0676543.1 YvrJ family protein [Aneurinibacillus thermoaerophilus]MED0678521.1 YvrJ family protein [Aneurinibacillus thermoaerophilus]MED0735958.1 YvrJ family protein [Aneurinibacillus thermoaerophilus]MED0757086.1 YvrJ family protein [Aneurinibacillus thermoaerophilus]MED0759393.1 YvrJ family protein [Aneurinibacillus thermoaerophilus]